MIWIFALGVLCLCVFSKGFRKFTIGTVAVVAIGIGVLAAVAAYQNNVRRQEAAQTEVQARAQEAKYPVCDSSDQTLAWFKAGGNCRPAAVANVGAGPAVLPVTESKPR